MPVRNEAAFLRACFASITPPGGLSCEVILVNDGSTDAPLAIAQDFARQASFPVTILHSPPRGNAAVYRPSGICTG
ncbi:MAG: glycosyltransferase family 2 protein [Paracoccaceae bacterium]